MQGGQRVRECVRCELAWDGARGFEFGKGCSGVVLTTWDGCRQVRTGRTGVGMVMVMTRTSLTRCILVCPFSPSIYLYVPYVESSITLLLFLCLILSSPSPSTLVSSIFILSLHRPYFSILYFPYDPFPIVQIDLIITTPHLYKYTKYKLL